MFLTCFSLRTLLTVLLPSGFRRQSRKYGLCRECGETVGLHSAKRRILHDKTKRDLSEHMTHPSLILGHQATDQNKLDRIFFPIGPFSFLFDFLRHTPIAFIDDHFAFWRSRLSSIPSAIINFISCRVTCIYVIISNDLRSSDTFHLLTECYDSLNCIEDGM